MIGRSFAGVGLIHFTLFLDQSQHSLFTCVIMIAIHLNFFNKSTSQSNLIGAESFFGFIQPHLVLYKLCNTKICSKSQQLLKWPILLLPNVAHMFKFLHQLTAEHFFKNLNMCGLNCSQFLKNMSKSIKHLKLQGKSQNLERFDNTTPIKLKVKTC